MPLPLPPQPLTQHCTCLHDDQLFAYTGAGFYKLPLQHGGNWTELETILNVQGAACLHIGEDTPDEALYVIGGNVVSNNNVPSQYAGLMRYNFNIAEWEILPKQDQALYNLTNHAVTYMEQSKQIMVFSGSKWPQVSVPSSQMFLVSTEAPYGTISQPTGLAPPLLNPLVLPWGNNGGIVLGGGSDQKNLYTFNAKTGWSMLGSPLPVAPPDQSVANSIITEGEDGSRTLVTFNFGKAPAEVTRTVLKDGLSSQTVPNYNGTFAPQEVRRDFALAYNKKWVVVSGGGEKNDPLCVFDYQKNRWLNATALLSVQKPLNGNLRTESISTTSSKPGSPSTTSVSLSTTSSSATTSSITNNSDTTPTSSSSTFPLGNTTSANKTTTQLLFIILGVVLLAGVILGIAYLALRRKKKKLAARNKANGRDTKNRSVLSIQDRGLSYLPDDMYKKPFHEKDNLESGFQRKANLSNLDPGTYEMQDRQRGSGWSKYFSGHSSNPLSTQAANINRSTSNASRSTYSMSSMPDDFDSRRTSIPTIGLVRSSTATSTAMFSSALPTPTVANISSSPQDHDNTLDDKDRLSASNYQDIVNFPIPKTAATTTTVNSMQFWGSDFGKPHDDADGANHLWYAPSANHDHENDRIPSILFPPHDPNRGSAMTLFPGGSRDSNNTSLDFTSHEADNTRAVVGKPSNHADNLGWFNRFD